MAGEPLAVAVATVDGQRHSLRIIVTDEHGRVADARLPKLDPAGAGSVTVEGLPPGAYTVDVTGTQPGSPVSSDVVVWADTP
ncbi:hypothetical protein [Dactylosporangium darangshiense]|uniref:Carboxypeptidase regulatory-like domain-containing protein n=1 Tax=Dactylosporangium darangshiense TaxID=579108 RepID=A0ABP8DV65_9ACTN